MEELNMSKIDQIVATLLEQKVKASTVKINKNALNYS